jgi:uncharacterized membrane protein YhaH (DUF805 family)
MHWMMMPLRRYADFSGRSRRMEFWMWQLFKFLVSCVLWILFIAMFGSALFSGDPGQMVAAMGSIVLVWGILMLFALAILVPDIAVAVRRLHDINRTGWWILAPVAPYLVGWMALGASLGSSMAGGGKDPAAAFAGPGGIVFLVAMLVAVALAITLLVFYFLEGTRGPNKYGPDPKAPNQGEVFV